MTISSHPHFLNRFGYIPRKIAAGTLDIARELKSGLASVSVGRRVRFQLAANDKFLRNGSQRFSKTMPAAHRMTVSSNNAGDGVEK
ncbi:MAG TPA: hypothetical protein VF240_06785 [Pyrinomonadaceae bacterium]